jgi:2-polyprenyl-6-methoxyphenol hydroxylase-like FAD-dependent oxidoreductase
MNNAAKYKGRVAIIGGSMAGLFAAATLRKLGWQADIYERAGEALANRGAGIATHDELYAAVRAAGIDLREEMGVRSKGRIMFERDGRLLGRHDLPQIMTSWGLIYRFLRAQIADADYHNGHTLCGIEHHGAGVTAVFDNGKRIDADWLLGADGTRSSVRAIVAPEAAAQYCGYFGWRGLIDEALIAPAVLATHGFWYGTGWTLVGISGGRPQGCADTWPTLVQLGLVSHRHGQPIARSFDRCSWPSSP